ncbi:MAG: DUF1080 domain-containing protein [Pirellulaceae bacterium]|nr:DUF1080 domain-containing protein [Pirellulaceae bacterium]
MHTLTNCIVWGFHIAVFGCCLCQSLRADDSPVRELRQFERQQLTGTYYSEGIAVGDLNGDGTQDIVYGPMWYAGPSFEQGHEIYPAVAQPMEKYADHFFAWVYDFDGDGAQDVLAVGFPGTAAYVYRNPGKGVGKWSKHQVLDWVSNESPQFTQLTGNATPELICTRDGFFGFATIDASRPLEAWTFHPISEKIAPARFGHGLGVGDVNGDGLMDVIHSGGWFEQPASGANNGRWRLHEVSLSNAYGGADMFAYDVDGDGLNDIITSEAAHDFGISWYRQVRDGDHTRFERQVIMGQQAADSQYGVLFTEPHSLRVADIDGDGLQDIVSGKTYYSHHRQSPMWDAGPVVYWFRLVRTEAGIDWLPYLIDSASGIGRQVIVADINGDGLPDVATGGMLGAHVLLQKVQQVSEEQFRAAQPKPFVAPAPPATPAAKRLRGSRNPIGADGKISDAIEAEKLKVDVSRGTAQQQSMQSFPEDRWSSGKQLWWTGGKPGDRLTVELDVLADVTAVQLVLTCAPDYGVVQFWIDDQRLGEAVDLYEPKVVTSGLLEFASPQLQAGKHTLSVEIVGANPKAVRRFMFGIDCIRFRQSNQPLSGPLDGVPPVSSDGRKLNLDFETGDLTDWTAEGQAFTGQPVRGDAVALRRDDDYSRHEGNYWVGSYERSGDAPQGTLTSVAFRVSQPYAAFLIGGGNSPQTRVELFVEGQAKPFFVASGKQTEKLSPVVVDLREVLNKQVYIRLVDESSGGWGHINFDHFRLHPQNPVGSIPTEQELSPDQYPYAGLPAQQAAAAMKLPEGFHVIACAAEPNVKQPIAMAVDDRGRVWIAEAYEYPIRSKAEKGRDRILIFEDTSGDGVFDSHTVFYEGLNLVSGLEVGFGGVWVGAAPYLLFIPDANGDDIPDGEPQVLLDGWGYQDTHETLNTFCWGPDGWLYGCHGVFTHSKVGKPGTEPDARVPINAGVWRYHPLRHEFEVFAHGTSNPWGLDFNEVGQAFVTACVIPHLYHIIPQGRYQRQAGRHFNPHTYDNLMTIADHFHYLGPTPHSGNSRSDAAGGGHAHAGALIYQGGAWPDEYRGALLMNNIHGQRLNMDRLIPSGSGYVGKHAPDFLLTGDQASQILNMQLGPDGQVLMIDWYDMQACHRNEVEVHDRSNGRIYKICYGPHRAVQVELAKLTDAQLVQHTLSENEWYVRHARRLLQERAARGTLASAATDQLITIATTHASVSRRLRAIWALHVVGTFDQGLYGKLLTDSSPQVRDWAVRLRMEQLGYRPSADELQQLVRLAQHDTSPVVRLSLASVGARLPTAQRWSLMEALTGHGGDSQDHNLPLMYWYAMEPLADEDPDRAMALGIRAGQNIPLLREFMLRRLAASGGTGDVQRLVNALGRVDSAEIQLTFLSAIQSALAGQRRAPQPDGWPALYAQLASSSSAAVQSAATRLGVVFGDAAARQRQREILADTSEPESAQLSALQSLLSAGDDQLVKPLLDIIGQRMDRDRLVEQAIIGLAQYEQDTAAQQLVNVYDRLTANQRRAAIATLCARKSSGHVLLDAISAGRIKAADLTADLARQLEHLSDAGLSEKLAKQWGQVRRTAEDKSQQIKHYAQLIHRSDLPPVDLALGRALFAKTCQRCHVLYGIGQQLGPDITGSNRTNIDYLLENIVDPSAVMAKEYRQSIALTYDGQVITGIVRQETDAAVTIQTAEASLVVPKAEIDSLSESQQSMMPDDQLSQFSDHEVRSLLAYLRHSQQTPLLATTENARDLFNGRTLDGWSGNMQVWSVQDGEIVGSSQGLHRNEFLVSDLLARDFKLSLEVKLVDNKGNSGIQFRSRVLPENDVAGYQADIGAGWWGKLYEEHGRQILWKQGGEQFLKSGQWNTYEIEAIGSHVRTWLNGNLCVDLDDPAGSREGIFALQVHSGSATEVRFRNLKLEVK